MIRKLIPLLLVALLLPALSALAVEPGSQAPDLSLKTLDGKVVHLSDFKGRPILLKLATTWCATCRQQGEEILSIEDFLAKNDVMVVEVFVEDSPQMVLDYLKGRHATMPDTVLMDDGSAIKSYNVFLIPRTILIDRNFIVRRDGSLMPASELEAAIKKILAEK